MQLIYIKAVEKAYLETRSNYLPARFIINKLIKY